MHSLKFLYNTFPKQGDLWKTKSVQLDMVGLLVAMSSFFILKVVYMCFFSFFVFLTQLLVFVEFFKLCLFSIPLIVIIYFFILFLEKVLLLYLDMTHIYKLFFFSNVNIQDYKFPLQYHLTCKFWYAVLSLLNFHHDFFSYSWSFRHVC